MLFPSFEEVQALSAQFTLIPVSFTFAADHCSPLGMYQALAEGEPYALLLEGDFAANGRYAIAAAAPALTVRMENAAVSLKNGEEWAALPDAAPADFLHTLRNACTSPACQPFFSGGLTGCCPDAQGSNGLLCQFQELAVYDRMNETITIVLPIHSTADLGAQYQAAEIRAAELGARIDRHRAQPQYWDDKPPVHAAFPITEHDFAQHTVTIDNAPDSFEVYRRLRRMTNGGGLLYQKQDTGALLGWFPIADADKSLRTAGFMDFCGREDLRPLVCAAVYERDRAALTVGGRSADEANAHAVCLLDAMNASRR